MRAYPLVAVAMLASSLAPAAFAADPKVECLAAADQGQTLREDGKYRKARDAFVVCSRNVCPNVVMRSCTRWLRELDDSTPTVVPGAKDDAGADLTQVHVTVDGQTLTDALDGKPAPVDPGEHTLRFTRPESAPVEVHVVVRAGEKNRAVVVTLHAAARENEPPPHEAPAPEAPASEEPASKEPEGSAVFTPRNMTAAALAVLGAGALAVGGYFVSQSGSQSSTSSGLRNGNPLDYCTVNPSNTTCAQLKSSVDAQHRDTAIGASMLVGGGTLLVAAVVTWLAWPAVTPAEKTGIVVIPELSPGFGALGVAGSF